MTEITLYSTGGCHLCHIAKKLLLQANQQIPLTIIDTEISDNDTLITLYDTTIPVIKFEGGRQLNWPFKLSDIISNLS